MADKLTIYFNPNCSKCRLSLELLLDNPELSRADLISAMIAYPRVIERPVVVKNGKAAIGRPPERILDIL
jgi:arsenate reductase